MLVCAPTSTCLVADLLPLRKVGFHFWSALPPAPAQAADNSPVAAEGRLRDSCQLPCCLQGPSSSNEMGWRQADFILLRRKITNSGQ